MWTKTEALLSELPAQFPWRVSLEQREHPHRTSSPMCPQTCGHRQVTSPPWTSASSHKTRSSYFLPPRPAVRLDTMHWPPLCPCQRVNENSPGHHEYTQHAFETSHQKDLGKALVIEQTTDSGHLVQAAPLRLCALKASGPLLLTKLALEAGVVFDIPEQDSTLGFDF